jgi:integrase
MPEALSARAVLALPPRPQPYWVDDNLYLDKHQPPGSWVLMYVSPVKGKRVEMGLGRAWDGTRRNVDLTLAEAKAKALEYRAQIVRGRCPLSERQTTQAAGKIRRAAAGLHLFHTVAELYINAHRARWTSIKHRRQWESSLQRYAYPVFGDLPVAKIGIDQVMSVLEPLWYHKPETAGRVRGRIESVLDYATARGWRSGDNPARWRGHLDTLLPAPVKVRPVEHQPAVAVADLPGLYQRLCADPSMAALALRYTILTAARSAEVRRAVPAEIDRDRRVHSLPAERMKQRRPHTVPLSREALAVLDLAEARRSGSYCFSGGHSTAALGDTTLLRKLHQLVPAASVHGFRSAFRTYCSEAGIDRELAEMALAHRVGDKTENAYARSNLLERRRAVMERWSAFLTAPAVESAAVIVMGKKGARKAG